MPSLPSSTASVPLLTDHTMTPTKAAAPSVHAAGVHETVENTIAVITLSPLTSMLRDLPLDKIATASKELIGNLEHIAPLTTPPPPQLTECLSHSAITQLKEYSSQWVEEYHQLDPAEKQAIQKSSSISIPELEHLVDTLDAPATAIALNLKALIHPELPELSEKIQQLVDALFQEQVKDHAAKIIKLFSELLALATEEYQQRIEQQLAAFLEKVLKETKKQHRRFINKAVGIAPFHKRVRKILKQPNWDTPLKARCLHLLKHLESADSLDDYFHILNKLHTLPEEFKHAIRDATAALHRWMSGKNSTGLDYLPKGPGDAYEGTIAQFHLQEIQRHMQTHYAALLGEKKSLSFPVKRFIDRFLFDTFGTDNIIRDYKLANKLLDEANKALQQTHEKTDEARLIILLGSMKKRTLSHKESLTLEALLGRGLHSDLETLLADAGHSLRHHEEVNTQLNDLLQRNAILKLNTYRKLRLYKPLLGDDNSFSFKAIKLRLFDALFPGGKFGNRKSKHQPHDGLHHRQQAARRLAIHLAQCNDPESYFNYVGLCCYELSHIQDKHSTLKKMILQLVSQIIAQKIIPEASNSQKIFIFRMLTATVKQHPELATAIAHLRKDLIANGVQASFLDHIERDTQSGVKLITQRHQAALQQAQAEQEKTNEAPSTHESDKIVLPSKKGIEQSPALSVFHNTVSRIFNARLAAYKIAPSGAFQKTPGSYSEIGGSLTSAISQTASATGLPFLSSVNNIISYVANNFDQDQNAEIYRNVHALFSSTERCEQFSAFLARTLTQIWEYQIEQIGVGNANLFAQCAVERMISFLMAGKFRSDIPIETQLIAAVRTQYNSSHGLENTLLNTVGSSNILAGGAWVLHDIFEKTPIYDSETNSYYYSSDDNEFDHRFGAARDGAAIADALNVTQADEPIANEQYAQHHYKTASPVVTVAMHAAEEVSDKLRAGYKKLKTMLRQRDATIAQQGEQIQILTDQNKTLTEQVASLQNTCAETIANYKTMLCEFQELKNSLAEQRQSSTMPNH